LPINDNKYEKPACTVRKGGMHPKPLSYIRSS